MAASLQNNVEYDWQHILKATCLAGIATLLLIYQQTRHGFYTTRKAFIEYRRQCNRTLIESTEVTAKSKKSKKKAKNIVNEDDGTFIVGFFHPYCASGGGGERVLWKSIQALGEMKDASKDGTIISNNRRSKTQKKVDIITENDTRLMNCKKLSVVIYTIDKPTENYDKNVLEQVKDRFGIVIPKTLDIHFVHLHEVKYLLDKPKRFTLIAESIATMKLAYHALTTLPPHVYIDTTGCAFTFLVARILAGCKVATYVHYPTISTDMLSMVWDRRPSYNNNVQISNNILVTCIKLVYYTIFAMLYGIVGSLANLTMVNSTWTKNHISSLWKLAGKIHVVYPPVDTKSLKDMPLTGRENGMILSIGQFRPEKDHVMQLHSFAKLIELVKEHNDNEKFKQTTPILVLIGSCRNEDDQQRVDELQKLARELTIQDNVKFVLNEPYSTLKEYFSKASIGIHTMWNEHFGIGVVEMMAAGLVTIAHDSGGPSSDIILYPYTFGSWTDIRHGVDSNNQDTSTGCLASSVDEYADFLYKTMVREGNSEKIAQIRKNGRQSAERFSDEVFMESFKDTVFSSSLFK